MDVGYSFLQRSENRQFKDLAFFEILKRKGPYVERSLTKIQNDLFYRHKISGGRLKDISFIKQIRQTLVTYQVIINEIKNDFSMTELDSLGEGIHHLFSQMISIVSFFIKVILKKEKLSQGERDPTLQELRDKDFKQSEISAEEKLKIQKKQKENSRQKDLEHLKYNFKQLFKMEAKSETQNRLIEKLWSSIVESTKTGSKNCATIKSSHLDQILKDSCEFLYKNHTELNDIIRITRQDIIQSQKNMESFEDKSSLLRENQQKIDNVSAKASEITSLVKGKIYEGKSIATQTLMTQINDSKPLMTTKQLDERRKLNEKVRLAQKQVSELNEKVELLNLQIKRLEIERDQETNLQSYSHIQYSQVGRHKREPEEDFSRHRLSSKLQNMKRKSKSKNFNSFKVSSIPRDNMEVSDKKRREASFTTGKNIYPKSQNRNSTLSRLTNRSSVSIKDFSKHSGRISRTNIGQNKFTKLEEQISNKEIECDKISESLKKQTENRKSEDNDADSKSKCSLVASEQVEKRPSISKQVKELKICFQTVRIRYRPPVRSLSKLSSTRLKDQAPKKSDRLLRVSKGSLKKISSQHSRYYFEPLSNIDRPIDAAKILMHSIKRQRQLKEASVRKQKSLQKTDQSKAKRKMFRKSTGSYDFDLGGKFTNIADCEAYDRFRSIRVITNSVNENTPQKPKENGVNVLKGFSGGNQGQGFSSHQNLKGCIKKSQLLSKKKKTCTFKADGNHRSSNVSITDNKTHKKNNVSFVDL